MEGGAEQVSTGVLTLQQIDAEHGNVPECTNANGHVYPAECFAEGLQTVPVTSSDTADQFLDNDSTSNSPKKQWSLFPDLNRMDYADSPLSSANDSLLFADDSSLDVMSQDRATPDSVKSSKSRTRKFLSDLYDIDGNLANDDLRQGYTVLKGLMSFSNKAVNTPFLHLPDKSEHPDFYETAKIPAALTDMQDKFENFKYSTITDFVKDFRNMLENYLRYFGPDDVTAKKAQKFDIMMEQKLALLSKELKDLTSLERTHGPSKPSTQLALHGGTGRRTRQTAPNFTAELINTLRLESKEKEKEMRKQQIAERQKERETHSQELTEWEDSLYSGTEKQQLLSSWELPQIGLFIYLCQETLNCGEISQFDIERCLLLVKESQSLHAIMTSLLSTPFQRQYLDRRPAMPYNIWSEKLKRRLDAWYKTLEESDKNYEIASDKLGIETKFWDIVGRLRNPLNKTEFYNLTYYQRIWIVKSLCDNCMATQSSLRETIDSQSADETREYLLGSDTDGATYIHFPQFCGVDLRVYKIIEKPTGRKRQLRHESPDLVDNPEKENNSLPDSSHSPVDVCGEPTTPVINSGRRKSKANTKPQKTGAKYSECDDDTGLSARALRLARRHGGALPDELTAVRSKRRKTRRVSEEASERNNDNETPSKKTEMVDTPGGKENKKFTSIDKAENSEQEKLPQLQSEKMDSEEDGLKCEKENEAVMKDIKSDESSDREIKPEIEEAADPAEDTQIKAEVNSSPEQKFSTDNNDEKKTPTVADGEVQEQQNEPIPEVDEPEVDLITEPIDMESFQVVCQSVDELKTLCNQFEGGKGKEGELYSRLSDLLRELSPFESKLQQLRMKAIEKLRKDKDEYKEPENEEEADGWGTDDGEESEAESVKSVSQSDLPDSLDQDKTDNEYIPPASALKKSSRRHKLTDSPANNEPEKPAAEFGVSAFGRIRKRRVIPNNLEDEGFFGKKKKKKQEYSAATPDRSRTQTPEPKSEAKNQSNQSNQAADTTAASSRPHRPQIVPSSTTPSGFTLVRINKQMYLVPTAQLPALLAQSHAGVQVINKPVQIVNQGRKAKKTSHVPADSNPSYQIHTASNTLKKLSEVVGKATDGGTSSLQTTVNSPQILNNPVAASSVSIQSSSLLKTCQLKQPHPKSQQISLTPPTQLLSINDRSRLFESPIIDGELNTMVQPAGSKSNSPSKSQSTSISKLVAQPAMTKTISLPASTVLAQGQTIRPQGQQPTVISVSPSKTCVMLHNSAGGPQTVPLTPQLIKSLAAAGVKIVPNPSAGAATLQIKTPDNKQLVASTSQLVTARPPASISVTPKSESNSLLLNQLITKPSLTKYTGGITVKELLDKQQQTAAAAPGSKVSEPIQGIQLVAGQTKLLLGGKTVVPINSRVLDAAVKAVVTESIKTTLPTAAMKIPAPSSLPSAMPRRPPTKTTQAMKAPIQVSTTGFTKQAADIVASSSDNITKQNSSFTVTEMTLEKRKQVSELSNPPATASLASSSDVIGSNIISVPASSFVTTSSQAQGQILVQSQLPVQTISAVGGSTGKIMLKVLPQASGAMQASSNLVAGSKVISLQNPSPSKVIQVALSKGAAVGGQLVRLPDGNTAIISGVGVGSQPIQLAANTGNQLSSPAVKLGGKLSTMGGQIVRLVSPSAQPVIQQGTVKTQVLTPQKITVTPAAATGAGDGQHKQYVMLNYPAGQAGLAQQQVVAGGKQLMVLSGGKFQIASSAVAVPSPNVVTTTITSLPATSTQPK